MTAFLHPAHMRRFLADHRGDVVEAFEYCFGVKPTSGQISLAVKGGMRDRRTILSLPDQVCAWRRIMHGVMPSYRIENEVLVGQIAIGPFQQYMVDVDPRRVRSAGSTRQARMFWAQKPVSANVHPVDAAFIVHLGRYVEPGGFNHYAGAIERGEMSVHDAVAEIAGSDEARMLRGEI